jgi:hypothetical protein
MPSADRRPAFSNSRQEGQATLITTPIGISRPRRRHHLGPQPTRCPMRSPLSARWKVEGPNEQKVVSLLTSFRTPQQIVDFDPDAPDPLTARRGWRREIKLTAIDYALNTWKIGLYSSWVKLSPRKSPRRSASIGGFATREAIEDVAKGTRRYRC